ncbi:7 transmembrane sweet-taste receptor of 3 GCPR [Popillia japonica]|uniref:7 transmembrane sweet-taste receptor of 3 GCPR n=1 Tax=Popillia japonica TaxID=7064 RepID=A0AAW1L603_POPJA
MKDNDDVRNHLNKFSDTVDKLSEMNVINEDLLSIMMLHSLPPFFETFRIAIESRDQLPSPENLKIKILEESEARSKTKTSTVEGAFFKNLKIKILEESEARSKTKTSTVEGAFFSRNYKRARRTTSSNNDQYKQNSKQKCGDLKINLLLEDCTEDLPVESSLGRTYINSAIWIIERLNLLQITTPLTLGLSVYQICNDSEVYNSLFHIFQQHHYTYQVGIVNVKPFSRSLIDFCTALNIKTNYIQKYRKPLIRASVELLTLLNWKDNITLLTQYKELVPDFYKYSRKQWICVQRLINSEINPITLSPSSPTVVLAEKEVINIILNQLHTQKLDWKIIFVPLDGEPISGLPEGSYLIQPTYGDIIQTFTATPKIIPSPLFFDIAHPLINYAKELSQVIIQQCSNTSYKLNCLRNKYRDIFSYQANTHSSLINFLKIEPLSAKFNYNIYRIDNVSSIDLNKEKTFYSLSKIFSYNIFDDTLLEIDETVLEITNTTNTSTEDCSKRLPSCVLKCLNFQNPDKRTIMFSINIYPRSDSWIFAFISVSILGVIFCLAIIIFILVRLFQRYIFEGNPTLTILLLVVVVVMYLSIIPFALDSDDKVKTNIMMARSLCISLPYAAAFSLLLSRAILLATISKEVGFMSHVAGTVQSFLCLFIFGVQCAVSLQVVRHCEDTLHDFLIMYLLCYNIILLLMLLCLTPLIVRSQRNYKEGRYFTIATVLTALSWSIWVPTYVLLEEEWKDPILCMGLVCTASILLGSLFIPRTYMMAVAAARDRFASALPSLATATSAMDIYRPLYDCVNIATINALNARNANHQTNIQQSEQHQQDFYSCPTAPENEYEIHSETATNADKVTRF